MMMLFLMPLRVPLCSRAPSPLFVVAVLTLMCMMVVVPGVEAAEENFTDENYTRIENNTLYVVDCSLPPTTTLNATFYSTELLLYNVSFQFLNCGTIQQRGFVRILGRYEAVWNDVHVLIRNCVVNNRRGFYEPLPAELDHYWQLTQSGGRLFYAFTTIWTIGQYNNVSLRVESSKVNATSLFVARGVSQNHLRIEVIDSSTNCAHPTFWVISPISGSLLYLRNANLTILRSFVFTRIESRYWLINAGGVCTVYANYLSDFYVQTIDSNFSLQFNITEGVLADDYDEVTVMAGIMLAQSNETEFHRVALDSLHCSWTLQSGPIENYEWDSNGVGHANPTQVYVYYLTTGLSAAFITATDLSFRIRGGSLALSSTAGSHGMYLNRVLVDHLRIHVSNINHVQIACTGVISKLTPQRTGSLVYLRGLTKPTGIVVVEVHDLPSVVILVTSGSIDVDSPSAQYPPIHSTSKGIGILQPQAVQLATAQLVIVGSLIGTPGTVSSAVRQVHPWNCQSVFDSPSWISAIVSICNISMRAEVQNGTFTGRPPFFLAPGMMFSKDTPLPAITLSIAALRLEQDARASVIVRDVFIRVHDVHVDGIIGVVVADLVFPGQMPAAIDVFVTTITALIIQSVDTNDTFVSITNSSLETMPMQTTMPLPIRTYSPLFQNVSDNFFRYPSLHGFNASGILVAQDPSSLMSTFVLPLVESNPFLSGQASQLPFSTLTLCRVNFSFQNVDVRSPFLAGEIQRTSFEAQAATFVAPFVATKVISIVWHPLAALLVPSSSMLGTRIEMIRCSHVSARPVAVIGSIAPLRMAASRSADGVLHSTLISIQYGGDIATLFNDDQPLLGLATTPLNFGPDTELRLQHVTIRNSNNSNNKYNNASFVPSNVVFSPSPPSLVILDDSVIENYDSFFPLSSRSRVWRTVSGFQLGCNAFLPPRQSSTEKYIALEDRGAIGAAPRQTIHFAGNMSIAGRGSSTAAAVAPSSLVCTGRLYPVLTETKTLTLLPPPQPPGSPLSKTGVSSVALSGAVVLAALHAMPSFIPAMQRSALVMRCLRPSATEQEGDQAATEPGMLISDSPTQLQIAFKDPQMAFVRGTVVGNLILWGVVFTLQIGIGLFATRNAPHSGGWRFFSRFPGSWVFPYSILAQPTLASAVQLLVDREAPAMDVSIGLVGLVASLWPPLWYGWFVIAAYASWPSRRPPMGWWAVFRPPLWCRGATTKQGESLATVFLTKMPAKLSILRLKRQRRKMGLLRELWDVIARDRYEWRPLRKCPQFFATYGMLFEGYRQHQQWFFLIEFGILLAGGFASGLATPDSCDSFQGTFLVIAGVQFVSGLLFLPFVSVLADLVFILNALLSFVTSQLAVLDDVVAAQYAALVQGIIGIVLILPLFIAHYERIWQSVQRAIVFLRVHAGCADPDSGKEGDDDDRQRTKAGGTSASQSSSDTDGGESGRSTAQQRRRKQRATKLLPVTPPAAAATTAAAPSALLPPALLRQWQRTPLRSTHEKLQRLQLLVEAACASSPPPPIG